MKNLKPEDDKFHIGNGEDKKHYWLTPKDIYDRLDAEFHIAAFILKPKIDV